MPLTPNDLIALDAADPLAPHRNAFVLPGAVIYLDGNSLGALPRATSARVREVIEREWGRGLIRSWNGAGWIDTPRRIGAKIARLIGARPDEVVCADSTSLNLFKVLATALRLQQMRPRVSNVERRVILSERTNFPTDIYMTQGLIELLGTRFELKLVDGDQVFDAIDASVAAVMLTHVSYQTGHMHDMDAITRCAHEAGALMIWDLAHSAGAVPVDLNAAGADFAVGCGYKYLNGGPGAPAFVFVAARHLDAIAGDPFAQPLAGWFGHRAPFEFSPQYAPAQGIERYAVGTPSIVALTALDAGVDTVLAAGMEALRDKSVALTDLFIRLVDERCHGLGLMLVSPRDAALRGSQVCLVHDHAWPIVQALMVCAPRGVIGDFRAPNILRFGFAPLYVRFVDVWDAVEALRDVLATRAWDRPEFQQRAVVT